MPHATQTAPKHPIRAAYTPDTALSFDHGVLETFDGTWQAYRTALLERVFGRATP